MSTPGRRALSIDDPVGGRDACHVAHPASSAGSDGRAREIPLGDIHANPSQPRKQFDEAALAGLTESVRERGVLQPIIVRPILAGGYEIVAGERRWRAAQQVGRLTIPALIDASLDGADSLELALRRSLPLQASRGRQRRRPPSGVRSTRWRAGSRLPLLVGSERRRGVRSLPVPRRDAGVACCGP